MKIKKATPKDYSKMSYIWSECIMITCDFLTTSEINGLEKIFKEDFLNNPEVSHFTQWHNGELVGFACMKGNDILFTLVDPKLFGKGYGELMVKYLLESFEIEYVYAYCSDMYSLAFYSALGFEIEDKIDDILFGNNFQLNQLKLATSREDAIKKISDKYK